MLLKTGILKPKKYRMRKLLTVLFLVVGTFVNAQNGMIGDGFTPGWDIFNPAHRVDMIGSAGTSRIVTRTANAGTFPGNRFFRLFTNWDGNLTQWGPSGSDLELTSGVPATSIVSGSGFAFRVNCPNGTDNYVFKTRMGGNPPSTPALVFFRVSGAIQSVSSVTRDVSTVYPAQSTIVTATLSGAFASGQGVYLRYTTNSYASSTIVEMTGSGTTYTATIPSATNTPGANVSYYVFTSGSGLTITPGNADFFTINLNNNSGSNFNYTVQSSYASVAAGNWSNTSTWNAGIVPIANQPITISHDVTVDDDFSASSIVIAASRTLTVNSGSRLSVVGGVTGAGSLVVNGIFRLNADGFTSIVPTYGSASQVTYNTGGAYNTSNEWPGSASPASIRIINSSVTLTGSRNITGILTIETGGSLNVSSHTLTLGATSETVYSQILNEGTLTGNVVFQRAITGSTAGWRFFSPATSGTQNNLGTGLFFAPGGPANVINLSNGSPNAWQGVGGTTATALTPGRGYGVYFGTDGVNGTSTSGSINTTGSIQTSNVTVSGLTNGNSGSSFGWALVGNPFTAGFNFGDAANTKTNIDNTVWIWNPTSNGGSGGYASYNYTTSTSSPSGALNGVIPPTQGFIVKVNNTSPVLTMATAARTTATPNAQMRTASVLNRMYLTATNTQNGFNDELALVSWPTASTTFESDVDALKLNSFTSNAVNFSSKSSDNRLLSINSTSVWNDQLSIPLHIACTDAAAMKIEANLQEVDATLPVILEDRFLNRNHNLRQGAYQFAHVPAQADRFVIHFTALATSVQNNQLDKLLIYSASESLFVKGVEGAYELAMFDMQGRKVKAFVGNSDQEWNISELPKGAYVVHAQLTDGVKSFKVVR